MIFSSPIWAPNVIAKFYRLATCTYAPQIPYAAETYWQLFDTYRDKGVNQPRVLEIGCGTGFFLETLRQKGIKDVWGVEPGVAMVDQAPEWLRRRIKLGMFHKGMFTGGRFDVVVSWHTLDHLVDPVMVVKEVKRLLKPGGLVVVVVHDTEGISIKLWGEKSPIFDIEHVYLFNKQTLRELFMRHKFNVLNLGEVTNSYPPTYWLRMSGLPAWLKKAGQVAVRWLNLDRLSVPLKAGNISLVARKPG
ncbi:MAG: class I SAM-dependent methyltransferase [Candidatus Chisholmbacteria bacterium]|nr:class I SAM-dependent methyltransferase [Candidatus Chisholmbacteria bacterium]